MRILIVGSHIGSAMFVLSSGDHELMTITNLFPEYDRDYLHKFIEICDQSYVMEAVNVYNKTPWSEIIYLKNLTMDRATRQSLERISRMCTWIPDAIIYIYSRSYQITDLLISITTNSIIQTYSINADDNDFEINLKILIKNLYKKFM